MSLPFSGPAAYSEPGYLREAWGDPQPDGTPEFDAYAWLDGDVYRVGAPNRDAPEWRVWLDPSTGARMRLIEPNDRQGRRVIRWPLSSETKAAQAKSRESLNENNAVRATARTKTAQAVVERAAAKVGVDVARLADMDTPVPDLADVTVRQMYAIVADPEADLKLKRDATDIAAAWTKIGNAYRASHALMQSTAIETTEMSADDRAKLNQARNMLLMKQMQAS